MNKQVEKIIDEMPEEFQKELEYWATPFNIIHIWETPEEWGHRVYHIVEKGIGEIRCIRMFGHKNSPKVSVDKEHKILRGA